MNITIAVLISFISVSSFGSEQDMASIYAGELIKEFDTELELSETFDLRQSTNYAKLLAARAYIESYGHKHTKQKQNNVINITEPRKYNEVVNQIDFNARFIFGRMQKSLHRYNADNVIYPSTTKSGNVTGNTFPQNVWSLTFDDGPRRKRTKTIVDNLYQRGIKASFFMLTREAKKYSDTVAYVKDANMEIALHSYNHKNLNKASQTVMDYEVTQAHIELEKLTGEKINLFRLPYGAGMRNSNLRKTIAKNNLIHIFWNVDTLDWKDKDPKSIYARTIKQMAKTPRKSGVILFHDIHAQTVIASELVMDYLVDSGKKVCTTGDVIKYINGIQQNCLK